MIFRRQSYHAFAFLGTRRFFRKSLNLVTARVDDGVYEVVLTLHLWTKSYGVTIQMASLRKYFHGVLFVLKNFTK